MTAYVETVKLAEDTNLFGWISTCSLNAELVLKETSLNSFFGSSRVWIVFVSCIKITSILESDVTLIIIRDLTNANLELAISDFERSSISPSKIFSRTILLFSPMLAEEERAKITAKLRQTKSSIRELHG